MPDKLRIDLAYVERQSFLADLAIIFRTLAALGRKSGKGADGKCREA